MGNSVTLKQQKFTLTVLEMKSVKSRCLQGHTPSKNPRKDLFPAFLLASSGCWQPVPFPDL